MSEKKNKRLKPETWHEIPYLEFTEIEKFHGKEWYKKWAKAFGPGNTCPVIDNKSACCYFWDYERFADVVDYNKETYWD